MSCEIVISLAYALSRAHTHSQCKDEFAKIERREVKYREDLKNEKGKEKKAAAAKVAAVAKIAELEAVANASEASIPQLQV